MNNLYSIFNVSILLINKLMGIGDYSIKEIMFLIQILNQLIISIIIFFKNFIFWGLGIGDWGLGIGDWAQSPIPNPQSPIPNPHVIFYF